MILILPLSYLNEVCFLSLNTDDKKYNMCLKMAQEDLRDEIGTEFYEEIETQYDADSLTADNSTLYESYIKDFLAWQTYFNYLKFANVEATPSGIRTFKDENSDIASDIQMFSLEKNVLAQAKRYKFAIINFLKQSRLNDTTKYPLWVDTCKDQMSFSITPIDRKCDARIRINKSVRTNE